LLSFTHFIVVRLLNASKKTFGLKDVLIPSFYTIIHSTKEFGDKR